MEQDDSGSDSSRCFVPELLIDLLTKQISHGQAKTAPTSYFLHGVCLLVDISGFTKLSGAFCAEGKRGIDGLQLATNGYMGKLVETIYLFGGDIIKFAGDAILCIFPTTLVTKLIKTKHGKMLRRSIADGDIITKMKEVAAENDNSGHGPNFASVSGEDSVHSYGSLQREKVVRPDLLLRAMHCAESLKKITFETLTVHVAISCGEMCFGVLGGYENRWECLISGPCIHELSACLDEAPSMQAVMNAGCLEILRRTQHNLCLVPPLATSSEKFNYLSGYKYILCLLDSGNVTIVSVAKPVDDPVSSFVKGPIMSSPPETPKRNLQDHSLAGLVMQYVPTIVVSGIKQGTGLSYISEIREVTTMFMKWDSYDANTKHRNLIQLQDCFFTVQKILHTTGAYLRQFLVDDKGCVLIACWGMPSQTYLDNAHRALTSAVEIRTALWLLQMTCSFGMTTGDVYCGTVGSALRMEYAAIGSVVNMAARLMGKAHGSILIDKATFLRLPVTSHVSLGKLPPMQVKGSAEPIEVYEHCGAATDLSPDTSAIDESQQGGLELRDCCREPLSALLNRLTGTSAGSTANKLKHSRSAALNLLLSSFTSSMSPSPSPRDCNTLGSVLLEGKQGMGCKASTAWLCKQAQQRSVCTAFVKVADMTYLSPYYVLFKIFAQLGPKDLYRSKTSQRRFVHALLKEVYPDDGEMAVQVAFPVMKLALALTCTFSRDANSQENSSSVSSRSHGSKSIYSRSAKSKDKDSKFPPKLVTEVLTTIFKHLLTERTVLVIIDDIHNSDEESLRVLVELLKIDSRSAIVMTAVTAAEATTDTAAETVEAVQGLTDVLDGGSSSGFGGGGGWTQRFHSVVVSNHLTVVVAVDVFTVAEITAMLATLPESACFPPHLPALVQTLSGGEFAWIKEIIRFLREFGAPQLLAIVGESAPPSPDGKHAPVRGSSSKRSGETDRVSYITASRKDVSVSTKRLQQRDPASRAGSSTALVTQSSDDAALTTQSRREGFKIDQLVVCRYEKLRLSTKQILRTASIIGRAFSRQVLYGVLPRSLKGEVTNGLHTLVHQQWVQPSADDPELYEFRYEYSHQIIYNITPESERRNLHKVIADYIEEISAGDATQAPQLCYHYSNCDADKALYHTYIAVSHMLECNKPLDLCECIELMFAAVPLCTTVQDVEVLYVLAERAISKTREYRPPVKPMTHRVQRAVRHLRVNPLGSCFCGPNSSAVVPGHGAHAYGAEEDDGMENASDDSISVLSQNYQVRNYFLAQLVQLKAVLEQRKLVILSTVVTNDGSSAPSKSHKDHREWQGAVLHSSPRSFHHEKALP